MSKYKSKQQLIDEIGVEKHKLDELLNSLDLKISLLPGACDKWSVKDIICHLAEWQNMVLSWYKEGSQNKIPEVPGRGYKWSQLPDLNEAIYQEYKNYSYEEAQKFFAKTQNLMKKLIEETEEEIMLKPGLQKWMNKNTLIAYIGSCTSSHYKWASDLIKKFINRRVV